VTVKLVSLEARERLKLTAYFGYLAALLFQSKLKRAISRWSVNLWNHPRSVYPNNLGL